MSRAPLDCFSLEKREKITTVLQAINQRGDLHVHLFFFSNSFIYLLTCLSYLDVVCFSLCTYRKYLLNSQKLFIHIFTPHLIYAWIHYLRIDTLSLIITTQGKVYIEIELNVSYPYENQ